MCRRFVVLVLAWLLLGVAAPGATAGAPQTGPGWNAATGRLDPAAFADPPGTSRPHAFWFWNGELTEPQLLRQLDDMRGKGVAEFFIHPRQGLGGEFGRTELDYYLSKDWFDKVGFVLKQAKARGMKAWLYDDLNWPSGWAGGRVVDGGVVDGRTVPPNREYVPWYLTPVASNVDGPASYDEPLPEGELVAAVALPRADAGSCVTDGQARGGTLDGTKAVDLTGQVVDGRLRWAAPAGRWCVLRLVQRPLLNYHPDLNPGKTYVDMLNPAATRKFIEITHETYARRFGGYLGSTVPGIFNDEPGFYNNFPDGRGGQDSAGSIPWTPGFAGYLRQHSGYDLAGRLAAMWYDVGGTTTATRVDFHQALSDRYNEAHTKPLADWSAAHGMALISNPLIEEDLGDHRLIAGGSWFEMSRHYQLPGMDAIGGLDTGAVTAKLNSSVAHLFGRSRNLAETFGAFGWDLTMQEMKRTVSWAAAGGVDLIDNHAFYYSIDGERAAESPPSQFFQNTFWPRFGEYARFTGRLMEPARGARPVNPVGVLYPSTSVSGSGTPWNVRGFFGNGPELGPVDDSWKRTSNRLLAGQLDFDYLDEYALAGPRIGVEIGVDNGRLALRDQRWQALVLPRTSVLSLAAVRTMRKLVDSGGTVVAVDGLATREADGRDSELRTELTALFGTDPAASKESRVTHGAGLAAFLPDSTGLDALLATRIDPGISLRQPTPDVRVRHVKRGGVDGVGGDDAYLLTNISDRSVRTDAAFSTTGVPELWRPETGDTKSAPVFRSDSGKTVVPVELKPYEALWVVFRPGVRGTPHLTEITGGAAESVVAKGNTLSAKVVADKPGTVAAVGENQGQVYAGSAAVTDPLTPLTVGGDWSFAFPGWRPVTRPLGSWTDLDPLYSGAAHYLKRVELPPDFLAPGRRIILDLGQVRELAEVIVNGTTLRPLDWAPYTVDITDQLRPAGNDITVTVTNTNANAVQRQAVASGLLGPVVLRPVRIVDLRLEVRR